VDQPPKPSRPQPPHNPGVRDLVEGKRDWSLAPDIQNLKHGFRGWHERGYLPHRDEPGLTQFVTFPCGMASTSGRRFVISKTTRRKQSWCSIRGTGHGVALDTGMNLACCGYNGARLCEPQHVRTSVCVRAFRTPPGWREVLRVTNSRSVGFPERGSVSRRTCGHQHASMHPSASCLAGGAATGFQHRRALGAAVSGALFGSAGCSCPGAGAIPPLF
jgi:hypothetical protein